MFCNNLKIMPFWKQKIQIHILFRSNISMVPMNYRFLFLLFLVHSWTGCCPLHLRQALSAPLISPHVGGGTVWYLSLSGRAALSWFLETRLLCNIAETPEGAPVCEFEIRFVNFVCHWRVRGVVTSSDSVLASSLNKSYCWTARSSVQKIHRLGMLLWNLLFGTF